MFHVKHKYDTLTQLRQIVARQSVMLTEFQAPSFKLPDASIW